MASDDGSPPREVGSLADLHEVSAAAVDTADPSAAGESVSERAA